MLASLAERHVTQRAQKEKRTQRRENGTLIIMIFMISCDLSSKVSEVDHNNDKNQHAFSPSCTLCLSGSNRGKRNEFNLRSLFPLRPDSYRDYVK
jgi:hypothetical protein